MKQFGLVVGVLLVALLLSTLVSSSAFADQPTLCDTKVCLRVEQRDFSAFPPTTTLGIAAWDAKSGLFEDGLGSDNFRLHLKEAGDEWLMPDTVTRGHSEVEVHFVLNVPEERRPDMIFALTLLVRDMNLVASDGMIQGALWKTSADLVEVVPPTADSGLLLNEADSTPLSPTDRASVASKLVALLGTMGYNQRELPGHRQVVVLLTSTLEGNWTQITEVARQRFIPVYIVVFGQEQSANSDICQLVKETTGSCVFTSDSAGQIRTVSAGISSLGNRYILGYDIPLFPDFKEHQTELQIWQGPADQHDVLASDVFEISFPALPTSTVKFADLGLWLFDIVMVILLFAAFWAGFSILALWQNHQSKHRAIVFGLLATVITLVVSYFGGIVEHDWERDNAVALLDPMFVIGPERLPTPTTIPTARSTSTIAAAYSASPVSDVPVWTITSIPSNMQTNTPTPTELPSAPELTGQQWCDLLGQYISDPLDGAQISPEKAPTLSIRGVAQHPGDFKKYEVDLLPPHGGEFIHLHTGEDPVPNTKQKPGDLLANWKLFDSDNKKILVAPGWYLLRLRVIKDDGNGLPAGACFSRVFLLGQ